MSFSSGLVALATARSLLLMAPIVAAAMVPPEAIAATMMAENAASTSHPRSCCRCVSTHTSPVSKIVIPMNPTQEKASNGISNANAFTCPTRM